MTVCAREHGPDLVGGIVIPQVLEGDERLLPGLPGLHEIAGGLAGLAEVGEGFRFSEAVAGFPVPVLLLVGGVVLGLLLAALCRFLVSATARSRARSADRRLRKAIASVADELVVAPVRTELAAYDTVRENVARAMR